MQNKLHENLDHIKKQLSGLFTNAPRSSDEVEACGAGLAAFVDSMDGDFEAKYQALLLIDEFFQRKKSENNEQINERIKQLKKGIIHGGSINYYPPRPYRNWKDALLHIEVYQPISRTFLEKRHFYPDLQQPIDAADKARFKTFKKKNVCSISGSSFVTNHEEIFFGKSVDESRTVKESVMLNGSYTASTCDGWVMAVAGGCKHGDDETQNENIGRTAYFAAKNACRLMADYLNVKQLNQELSELTDRISQELAVKVRAHRNQSLKPEEGESHKRTALVCARAFQERDGFRLVGFNAHDTMLIAYNSATKNFQTIAKAGKDDELVFFDKTFPKESIVFGLTKEVWNCLPKNSNSEEDQQITGKIDTGIDFDELTSDPGFKFPQKITVNTLSKALFDYSIQQINCGRTSLLQAAQIAKQQKASIETDIKELSKNDQNNKDALQKKCNSLTEMAEVQKISVGGNCTLVGMVLSHHLDPNPEYTSGEVAASILTLGLYALIKDCLHIGTDNDVTVGDGFSAAAAVFGFFATGSLLGIGYLAYKGIAECVSNQPPAFEPIVPKF